MNFIDCLHWMDRNGFSILVKPAVAYHGCVEPQETSRVRDALANLAAMSLARGPCFLRTGTNAHGESVVWVFDYPRPAHVGSDVTELGPDESLPPYREEWDPACMHCEGQCPCYRGHAHIRVGMKAEAGS